MRTRLAFLVLTMFAATAVAHNVDGPRWQVREACKADIQTRCGGIRPGGGRIRACLTSNRDRLSQGCRDAITAAIAARRAARGQQSAPQQPD